MTKGLDGTLQFIIEKLFKSQYVVSSVQNEWPIRLLIVTSDWMV